MAFDQDKQSSCTLQTLGNRTLMQFNAERNSKSPIKAIRVTKIANLDIIFILTVCNKNKGTESLLGNLRTALPDNPEAINVSESTFLLASNVMVISIRVPINTTLILYNQILRVLQENCEYYPEIQGTLAELINTATPTPATSPDLSFPKYSYESASSSKQNAKKQEERNIDTHPRLTFKH